MMNAAEEVIVVADSTKFGHQNLAFLCRLDEVDRIVVDPDINDAWRETVRTAGVELVIAEKT